MAKFKNIFIIIFIHLNMFVNVLHAHDVTYTQKQHWNQWRLTNGHIILGNFLFNRGDTLMLNSPNSNLIPIVLRDLISEDQLLAKLKMANYQRQLLEAHATSVTKFERDSIGGNTVDILIILVGLSIFFLLIYYASSKNKIAAIPILLLTIVFLFAFTKHPLVKNDSTELLQKAFAPYRKWVEIRFDNTNCYISSNGLPQHPMMVGIRSWQQQVPLPQLYSGNNSWTIPLTPELLDQPISTKNNFYRGAIALAVNGIPIFNALNNRGEDAYLAGELDEWGGHCGRADDYHYHIIPDLLSANSQELPVAFALDGFAIYGNKEPDGAAVLALDSCNGHFDQQHIYHYHATNHYPYSVGAFRGKVQIDPRTQAPENQIIPQAFTRPVRPPGKPLRGAYISKFEATGPAEFTLTYQINNQPRSLRYFWNNQSVVFINQHSNGTIDSIMYPIRKF